LLTLSTCLILFSCSSNKRDGFHYQISSNIIFLNLDLTFFISFHRIIYQKKKKQYIKQIHPYLNTKRIYFFIFSINKFKRRINSFDCLSISSDVDAKINNHKFIKKYISLRTCLIIGIQINTIENYIPAIILSNINHTIG
jgi:hypothetical protein